MKKRASVGLWNFAGCVLVLFAVCLSACGEEKSICRKAFEVMHGDYIADCTEIVERDDCWKCPCLCYMSGREYMAVPDAQGLPDLQQSACAEEEPCDEERRYWAEGCLADREACKGYTPYWDMTWAGISICDPIFSEFTDPDICVWR
jgi:hypothetical protein